MSAQDVVYSGRRLWFQGKSIAATHGRGGITDNKCEGDGATPRGTHYIAGLYYRPDRIATPAPWAIPIGLNDLWCDASGHAAYNQLVQRPFAASHEVMRRADPQYDMVLITDWNWPNAVPNAGSAIFVHQWRRPGAPTAGCIAMGRTDLTWLAARAHPGTRLIII